MNQPLPAPTAGDTLGTDGRYRVVRRLATGGMGEVLLCEFEGDSKVGGGLVVVKRTFPRHPNRDHQNEMMREEARVALRLRHDNLVETFGLEEYPDGPLLAMEYLAGRSMAQVLGAAKRNDALLPPAICVEILRNAACGLHFAHTLRDGNKSLGLVHRDVSPANVFVTFDGRVKVIDFGVAKAEDSELRTSTGILKGKLGYMAPEHAGGEQLDARADLWSLGVVFWESLAARRLFKGNNPAMTLRQIAAMKIPPPSTLRPDVPRSLDEICLGLLDRNRAERFKTGRELVERLSQLSEFVPGVADLGSFLQERFPGEAHHGQAEAKRAARSKRRSPIPIGLVDGGGLVPYNEDAHVDVATAIMDNNRIQEILAVTEEAEPVHDDSALPPTMSIDQGEVAAATLAIDAAEFGALPQEDTYPGSITEPSPPSTTANLRVEELPRAEKPPLIPENERISSSVPAAPPAQLSGPNPASRARSRRRRGPSAAAFGLATFGVLSLVLGMVFAILTAQQKKPPTDVYLFYDAEDAAVLVAHQEDVPAAHFKDRFKVPLDERRDLPLTRKGPWLKPEPDKFRTALVQSGLWADANLPRSRRARLEVGLPALVAWLGLLSLALAIPSFLLRGGAAWMVRVLFTLSLLGAGGFVAWRGGLGWPGIERLQERDANPRMLKLNETFTPPGKTDD